MKVQDPALCLQAAAGQGAIHLGRPACEQALGFASTQARMAGCTWCDRDMFEGETLNAVPQESQPSLQRTCQPIPIFLILCCPPS